MRTYEERTDQFYQNRLFKKNEKLLFEKIEGMERQNDLQPGADETMKFSSDNWSKNSKDNGNAVWLKNNEDRCKDVKQQDEIKRREENIIRKRWEEHQCGEPLEKMDYLDIG